MPLAWLTNQPRKTNGVARTHPHGCSHAATTTLWYDTMGRRCWWRQACSWGGWVSFWTTTAIHCPSMMPWTPSTFIPLKSPSSSLSYPLSWFGISQSWFSQGYLSPTLSMVWPQIFKSSNSSSWACAGKSHHTWPGWRPATEKCLLISQPESTLVTERFTGSWKTVTEFCSNPYYEWTSYFLVDLESDQNMHISLKKCQSC